MASRMTSTLGFPWIYHFQRRQLSVIFSQHFSFLASQLSQTRYSLQKAPWVILTSVHYHSTLIFIFLKILHLIFLSWPLGFVLWLLECCVQDKCLWPQPIPALFLGPRDLLIEQQRTAGKLLNGAHLMGRAGKEAFEKKQEIRGCSPPGL